MAERYRTALYRSAQGNMLKITWPNVKHGEVQAILEQSVAIVQKQYPSITVTEVWRSKFTGATFDVFFGSVDDATIKRESLMKVSPCQ